MDFADTSPVALILSLLIGYLSGSVPYGLLLTQMAGLGDVRKIGSGNIGATNVGRVLGRSWGVLCLLLDVLKGLVPVWCCGAAMGLLTEQLPAAGAWRWLAVAATAAVAKLVWITRRQ